MFVQLMPSHPSEQSIALSTLTSCTACDALAPFHQELHPVTYFFDVCGGVPNKCEGAICQRPSMLSDGFQHHPTAAVSLLPHVKHPAHAVPMELQCFM